MKSRCYIQHKIRKRVNRRNKPRMKRKKRQFKHNTQGEEQRDSVYIENK